MSDHEADREKAMAAVRAMFERYKLIAAQRPKDHIVSEIYIFLNVSERSNTIRTLIARSWRAWSLSMQA
jgi:hypothetical protein